MYKTGRIQVKIGEKPFFFHFGMNAQAMSMEQMKNYDDNLMNQLRSIFWAGAVVCKENELPNNFSMDDMGNVIDLMSQEDYDRVMEEAQAALGKMMDLTTKIIGEQRMSQLIQLMTQSLKNE